jgi:drug/metabolite transporter (DMT)-like permease
LALIALGVVALLWTNLSVLRGSMLGGAAILLGASGLWAFYTIGLRRAGVDAIACNILLCAPSFVIVLALIAWGCVPTHLGRFTLADAAPFVLLQGIGVGLVSGFTYGFAIRRLGAERSAVIGSLTPALASLLAVPVLSEHLDLSTVIGIALITGGVIFANVNFTKRAHQDA